MKLAKENKAHQDMVFTDVESNYKNIGLELLSSFYWISLQPMPELKWIIKVDDNVIVNSTKLDDYLSKNRNKKGIHCLINNQEVERDPMSRNYVSKMEWIHEKYPKFCKSFFYSINFGVAILRFCQFITD